MLKLINSVKLHDTKSTSESQLHSYTLAMKYLKEKLIKYLGINLTKKVKDLDTENYKT
jgi:hypothetical protein